jgi:hypothetical protein
MADRHQRINLRARRLLGTEDGVLFIGRPPIVLISPAADFGQSASKRGARTWAPWDGGNFVRWAMFADDGKFRARFWEFLWVLCARSNCRRPAFQSSFGMSSAQALKHGVDYIDELVTRLGRVEFPKSKTGGVSRPNPRCHARGNRTHHRRMGAARDSFKSDVKGASSWLPPDESSTAV